MNERLMIQRLCWKEFRQLLPLLVMLPTLAALLMIVFAVTSDGRIPAWALGNIVFLGMPGLFAVGAGALLVGHEKEAMTIRWLSSLPIRPATIIRVKTATAVIGLAALWAISGIYFSSLSRLESLLHDPSQRWIWPANSLFILLAGIAIAWKVRSALVALLLVVPLAMVPYILAMLLHRVTSLVNPIGREPSAAVLIAMQLLCSVIAWLAVERFGRQALQPQRARLGLLSLFSSATQPRWTGASIRSPQPPLPALLWQYTMQSSYFLMATSFLLLFSMFIILDTERGVPRGATVLAVVGLYLSASWLGVGVFQSDSAHQRIRFLADRGVSPRLVWFTRQAVPLAVISGAFIFAVVRNTLRNLSNNQALETFPAIPLLTIILLLVTFAISQWIGQLISSPAISLCVAPLATAIPIGIYGSAMAGSSPQAALFLLLALPFPMIATYRGTRRWMEQRLDARFWSAQAGYAAAIIAVPWLPYGVALASEPGMSRQTRAEIEAVVANIRFPVSRPLELVANLEPDSSSVLAPSPASWNQLLTSVETQLRRTPEPVGASSRRVIENIFAINIHARLSLGTIGAEEADQARSRYQRSLEVLSKIAMRMRASPGVIDQDFADRIEIYLTRELRRPAARQTIGGERFDPIARQLANAPARRDARRRAVAYSWHGYLLMSRKQKIISTQWGGYELDPAAFGTPWPGGVALMQRRIDRRAEHLWRLANTAPAEATSDLLARIAQDWNRPRIEYDARASQQTLRVDDVDRSLPQIFDFSGTVAIQWAAGWEIQAAQLAAPRSQANDDPRNAVSDEVAE